MNNEYLITRKSIIKRNNHDGRDHSKVSSKDRPCEEAYVKDVIDYHGNIQSRYFIELNSVTELFEFERKYKVHTSLKRNKEFPNYIAIIMEDV